MLTLDINKDKLCNKKLVMRVNDQPQRPLSVTILNNGELDKWVGYFITFHGTNGAGKKVIGGKTSRVGDKIDFTFPKNAFSASGDFKRAYFQLQYGDDILTTGDFEIEVISDINMTAEDAEDIISLNDEILDAIENIGIEAIKQQTELKNTAQKTANNAEDIANSAKEETKKFQDKLDELAGLNETGNIAIANEVIAARGEYGELSKRLSDMELVINVKKYGAIGDGISDDTKPVISAVEELNKKGGRLHFPAGNYLISEELNINHHGSFISGDGAFWYDTKKYGTTITATDSFSGGSLISFDTKDGYIRTVGANDITFDAGKKADINTLTIVSGYDFVKFDNVFCKGAADTKHAWNIVSHKDYLSQTHTYMNCIGMHRNQTATASTVFMYNLQESVFINFKSWASDRSVLNSNSDCFEIKSGSGLSFINCSSVFSKGAGVKLEVGQVGGCKNITFNNHLFEDCESPFNIESHSFKCFGDMSTILEKGSKVKQEGVIADVYLSSKTGIYLDNASGDIKEGDIFDLQGNKIGTIKSVEKMKVSNITTVSTQTKFSSSNKSEYRLDNITNSRIHIDTQVNKKIDILLSASTSDIKLILDNENSIIDKGSNNIFDLGSYQRVINLDKMISIPEAIKTKEILLVNDKTFNIYVNSSTNGKIENYQYLTIYPNSTVTLKCTIDKKWEVIKFSGSFVGQDDTNKKIGKSFTDKREVINVTESKQIGASDFGNVITNKGAKKQVTMNLPRTETAPKAEFVFIKDADFKMFIQATNNEKFRGGEENGFVEIEQVGKSLKVVNNELGIWDIL